MTSGLPPGLLQGGVAAVFLLQIFPETLLHRLAEIGLVFDAAPLVPLALQAARDLECDDAASLGCRCEFAARLPEDFAAFFEPLFRRQRNAHNAGLVVFYQTDIVGFPVVDPRAVAEFDDLVAVFERPPIGRVDVDSHDDGGVGRNVEDAANVFADIGDIDSAVLFPAVAQFGIDEDDFDALLREEFDVFLRLGQPGAPRGDVAHSVDDGLHFPAVDVEARAAVFVFDFGAVGRVGVVGGLGLAIAVATCEAEQGGYQYTKSKYSHHRWEKLDSFSVNVKRFLLLF